MDGLLAATNGAENWLLDGDGASLYVAGDDGKLRIYDAQVGTLLDTVDVGFDLEAIAISPDGLKLAITEGVAQNVAQSDYWPSNTAEALVYVLDLPTLTIQTFVYEASGSDFAFADVAFSDSDTLQISEDILPGWSGWSSLKTLDLVTGTFSEADRYYSGLGAAPSLTPAPEAGIVLLGQLGLSSAEYYIIAEDGSAIHSNGTYENGVYGYAQGIEAISGGGADGFVALSSGGGLYLYDGNLEFIANLAENHPGLGHASGVSFNSSGTILYAIDSAAEAIVGIDTTTLEQVSSFAIGPLEHPVLKWGEELTVSSNERQFYFNTIDGVVGFEVPNEITGNNTGENLLGSQFKDHIFGLAGDDVMTGRGGNDRLDGGDRRDIGVFSGNRSDYRIAVEVDGISVTDNRQGGPDGSDLLLNTELLRFADGDRFAPRLQDQSQFRLFAPDGFTGAIGGSGTVYGSNGVQDVTVLQGYSSVVFDPSFQRGGDIVRLAGEAQDYSIVRIGSNAVLTDGDLIVTIPMGVVGLPVVFDDGARLLALSVDGGGQIGSQNFGSAAVQITAPADGSVAPGNSNPAAIARLMLAADGAATISGKVTIYGTNSAEDITLTRGDFVFDPSFARGNDTIRLDGGTGDFAAYRSGSNLVLIHAEGTTQIPVGLVGVELVFTDEALLLNLDPADGGVMLGDKEITATDAGDAQALWVGAMPLGTSDPISQDTTMQFA